MENDIINTSPESTDRYPMVIDGIPSHLFSGALVHPDSLIINSRSQIMAGYPLLSTLHGEHINDLQDNLPVTNHGGVIGSDASVSRNSRLSGQAIRDVSFSSSHPIGNNEFREQFMGGALLPTTSLAPLLETSSSLHENFNRVSISANSAFPLEDLRSFVSNGCSNTSNSSFSTSLNCEYNGGHGDMELIAPRKDNSMAGRLDSIWDLEKFMGYQELNGKAPMRTNEPFRFMASSDPPEWISSDKSNSSADNPRGYCMPSNELSLRLTTCQPSIISEPTIADKCSEISCSDVSQHSLHEAGLGRGLGSDQTSGKSKDLSLGFGSCGPVHFSHIMSGSKYINVAQQILTEIASYSLEKLDDICYSPGGIGTGAKTLFSSNFSAERDVSFVESDEYPFSAGKTISEGQMLTPQRQDVEAKKAQLLALLQVVDYRYNQCLDEIRTVISAFHAATELDPQIHARFVLQTISLLYNNLRDRIANQILAIGERLSSGCMREERSFESSFIQKQWALQQLRRKDHQSWRPQRGLPERSVSVLRAWMFQNFLHPYPKDTEKHLLAIRSGLTRSQVSNWFINARVRLWKPMIEEMYSEMNNRKGRRTEEGTNSHCRNHINIDEQRIRMN